MVLPAGFLDRLRKAIPLSDIVSKDVVFDSRKSNPRVGIFWAACPFHSESTNSFYVDDTKGLFFCFGCNAKGDAISFLMKKRKVDFDLAVRQLAYLAGMDRELDRMGDDMAKISGEELLKIRQLVVNNFTQENFLEVGVLTGWTSQIKRHPRLLRSLSWGDADYSGNVLDILTRMDEAEDGSIPKLVSYINQNFLEEINRIEDAAVFSGAHRSLGYRFVAPRNDIIGVMMPFGGSFEGVYDAIRRACNVTPLPAKRADEVWNHSVLMNDILELINHSAVVVCDLTGRNENVFYELGIAHAWGKPVIPITQSREDVPFDLRHHRYLHYLNNGEGLSGLSESLGKKLQSLLGVKARI